ATFENELQLRKGRLATGGRADFTPDRMIELVHSAVLIGARLTNGVATGRHERRKRYLPAVEEVLPLDDVRRQKGAALTDLLACRDDRFGWVKIHTSAALAQHAPKSVQRYDHSRRITPM